MRLLPAERNKINEMREAFVSLVMNLMAMMPVMTIVIYEKNWVLQQLRPKRIATQQQIKCSDPCVDGRRYGYYRRKKWGCRRKRDEIG